MQRICQGSHRRCRRPIPIRPWREYYSWRTNRSTKVRSHRAGKREYGRPWGRNHLRCTKNWRLGLTIKSHRLAADGRDAAGIKEPELAERISCSGPAQGVIHVRVQRGRSRFSKQMNAKIVYDLGTDPMWTSGNVLIYLVLCLLPARAQEGQDASNTLDRDLAE